MSSSSEIEIVKAALLITRATSPYSSLPWIADVRAAVRHMLPAERVDAILIALAQSERPQVELRRADMVDGVAIIAAASELHYETACWHYAGLLEEAE